MLTREKLDGLFDMPSKAAARALGISNNHLKRCCRRLGIYRWPHRKIQSLKNLLARSDSALKDEINAEIEKIRRDPNHDVSDDMKALTAMSYKHAFVTRQGQTKDDYDTPEPSEEPGSSDTDDTPDPVPPPETPKRFERRLRAFPIVVVEQRTQRTSISRESHACLREEPVMIPVAAMQLGEWRETLCTQGVRSRPTRALPFFPILSLYHSERCGDRLVVV